MIAKQSLSNCASIDVAILGCPGVLVNGTPDRRLGGEEQAVVADHLARWHGCRVHHCRRARRVGAVEVDGRHPTQSVQH